MRSADTHLDDEINNYNRSAEIEDPCVFSPPTPRLSALAPAPARPTKHDNDNKPVIKTTASVVIVEVLEEGPLLSCSSCPSLLSSCLRDCLLPPHDYTPPPPPARPTAHDDSKIVVKTTTSVVIVVVLEEGPLLSCGSCSSLLSSCFSVCLLPPHDYPPPAPPPPAQPRTMISRLLSKPRHRSSWGVSSVCPLLCAPASSSSCKTPPPNNPPHHRTRVAGKEEGGPTAERKEKRESAHVRAPLCSPSCGCCDSCVPPPSPFSSSSAPSPTYPHDHLHG